MDDRLQAELSQIEPDVPFRAITTHVHATWARTYHSRPELYLKPQTVSEVQKIVKLARRCRRRIVTVGCGHSPNDITCTSSWLVNLDDLNRVLNVDHDTQRITAQAGIRLGQLNAFAADKGLAIPNLGSICEQSIAGAISTGTHGSTLRHGTVAEKVKSLRIVLGDGSVKRASATENVELFRAALLSLGALGIIVEIEYQMCAASNIEWVQTLVPLSYILDHWETDLWTRREFVRVWWLPYLRRAVIWEADKTSLPVRKPKASWYGGSVGFHTYHTLLRISNAIPSILPWVEWFVFGMQYGFTDYTSTSGVGPMRTELLMDCLYSQFVNEHAIPLSSGPSAIRRLDAWLNHLPAPPVSPSSSPASAPSGTATTTTNPSSATAEPPIPFSARGLYVHSPIEVRATDSTRTSPRPYLDQSCATQPTLYLNATLYRPYHVDPPCKDRYYEAFEWLMRQYAGRPHWAKNFTGHSSAGYLAEVYGKDMLEWRRVRDECDPDGVFVGAWHRRNGLVEEGRRYECEERVVMEGKARDGGKTWVGEVVGGRKGAEVGFEGVGGASDGRLRTEGEKGEGVTGRKMFEKM